MKKFFNISILFCTLILVIFTLNTCGGSSSPSTNPSVESVSKTTNMHGLDGSGSVTFSVVFDSSPSAAYIANMSIEVLEVTAPGNSEEASGVASGDISCSGTTCTVTISGLNGCHTLTDYIANIKYNDSTIASASFNAIDDEFEWDPATETGMFVDFSESIFGNPYSECWAPFMMAVDEFHGNDGFVETTASSGWQEWTFRKATEAFKTSHLTASLIKPVSDPVVVLTHVKIEDFNLNSGYYSNGGSGFVGILNAQNAGSPVMFLGSGVSFDDVGTPFDEGPWGKMGGAANTLSNWIYSDGTPSASMEMYFCHYKGSNEAAEAHNELVYYSTDGSNFTQLNESDMTLAGDQGGSFYDDTEWDFTLLLLAAANESITSFNSNFKVYYDFVRLNKTFTAQSADVCKDLVSFYSIP